MVQILSLLSVALLLCMTYAHPAAEDVDARGSLATVIEHCKNPKTVALTFDDGPYIYLADILATLNNAGAKGTFFFNGNNYDCIYKYASTIRLAYNSNHQIASHTWSHAHLNGIKDVSRLTSEFERVETALQKITGARVAYTRPPYGEYNNLVRQVAQNRRQTLVLWDFDSGDSAGATSRQFRTAYDDVITQKPRNILALNHETYETTRSSLKSIIQKLQSAGYKLVTLSECLGTQPYLSVGEPKNKDSTWHC